MEIKQPMWMRGEKEKKPKKKKKSRTHARPLRNDAHKTPLKDLTKNKPGDQS